MALAPGTRIGTFEVSGRVGVGGMGEVYRARDTSLGREVAIKVLPEAFATDADRLKRFEREAQVLASMNHPNIATIYGIEQGPAEAGHHVRALILEFIEGDTLAERIALANRRRGLAIDAALEIARQIVEALDAAHERGIVHRDLKPANIKIRPDGTVKVLDFGIAKSRVGKVAVAADAATITIHPTFDGMILGSPGYMSPEQARGQDTDKRTDIWSFGCVLFEMLTGVMLFEGSTTSDVIAATLTREPDWSALPSDVPESIHRLLRRCLRRDPKRRLRDIGDAYADLNEPIVARKTASPSSGAGAPARPVMFQRLTDRLGMNESPAISPDGRMVAFVSLVAGKRQIWVRLLSGGAPLQITTGDEDHDEPRWTMDGSAIIYFARPATGEEEGTLLEVSALGGPARPLMSAHGGADSSHDGRRLAMFQIRDGQADLITVSRDDGRVEHIAAGPRGFACDSPRWSPDDRWLVFHARKVGQFHERLYVVETSGHAEPQLVARASALKGASWLPDGSGLIYSSSAGSTLLYPPTFNLRRVGRDGSDDRAITFGDVSYVEPDLDRSGKVLACRIRSQSDIWRFPFSGSPSPGETMRAAVRITRQSGQVQVPSVNPDGSEVVYLSDNGGHGNLWIARTDGTGVARQITYEREPGISIGVPQWSPVDNRILFVSSRERIELWMVNSDGRGIHRIVSPGQAACWSPDGAWIYFSPFADEEEWRIEKIRASGGPTVRVRDDDNSYSPAAGRSALYYAARVHSTLGHWDWEYRRADPEGGTSTRLGHVAGSRIPVNALLAPTSLSPDERWLARPMIDGATCNVFVMSTDGGDFEPVTDFGDRPTMIARQVSWAPDGQSIYAAVADINADIVLLDGLI